MNEYKDIQEFESQIRLYIRSGVQAIHICVGGQARAAEQTINKLAKEVNAHIIAWDCLHGFGKAKLPNGKTSDDRYVNMTSAFEAVLQVPDSGQTEEFSPNTYVVVRDPHYELVQNPNPVCALKLGIQRQAFNTGGRCRPIFLLTPSDVMNPDLVPYMKKMEYPLPSQRQRLDIFDGVRASIKDKSKQACSESLRFMIAAALAGMTDIDATDILSECIVRHGGIVPEIIETIEREKGRILRRSETLTYVPKAEIQKADELGGYGELKKWLNERALAYEPDAINVGLDFPKGIVLVGVPGTGKSVCASIIARSLNLPLVTFHIDAIFNSLVGESERRMRETIATVDSMEGAVLLIDEADKVLGGAGDSSGDSGVTRRIFGTLLSWLSSKKNRTFVVMTMNRITGMPPELLRKGRLDEIFFVDVPDEGERKSIIEIHLRKRGIDPAVYSKKDWEVLLDATREFVGAEIEQAVIAARFTSFAEDKKTRAVPTTKHLTAALAEMIPITKVDPENINAIRQFGKTRARSVSTPPDKTAIKHRRNLDVDLPFDSN